MKARKLRSGAILCMIGAGFSLPAQAQNTPAFTANNNLVASPAYATPGTKDAYSDDPNMPFRLGQPTFGTGVATVPTYQSIGIYWAPGAGAATNAATVRYRAVGTQAWENGLDLWFDPRNHEYRGSVTLLNPGTAYEIELHLQTGELASKVETTWTDNYPIATIVDLPPTLSDTYQITTSGTPGGYVLYRANPASGTTIDMGAQDRFLSSGKSCVTINASYVIVRGLTLKNCQRQGIAINAPSHDVVIEGNDISGFGTGIPNNPDGPAIPGPTNKIVNGRDYESGIYCSNYSTPVADRVKRVTIQRNTIHDPRYGSIHWGYGHPNSAQAVTFANCGPNHVIRYNDIYSTPGHFFNDGIGGGANFSFEGFPFADSDIYGNNISGTYDDAIESEGGNRNVRIWGNYLHHTLVGVAMATVSQGPIYVFRNILGDTVGMGNPNLNQDDPAASHGVFFKLGSLTPPVNGGRVYLFHNTNLQAAAPAGSGLKLGMGSAGGIDKAGGDNCNIVSRNNILQMFRPGSSSVRLNEVCGNNDTNADLYWGPVPAGAESTGIKAQPIFAVDVDPALVIDTYNDQTGSKTTGAVFRSTKDVGSVGNFKIAPNSQGYGRAVYLPNFNDKYVLPDVGAHQSGSEIPKMEFGAKAYLPQTSEQR